MQLQLINSISGKKEIFIPIDNSHIKMYVCGPTVYDRPHIGNARSAVTYDVIYRILKAMYNNVTYVRNITDVDDKIINSAILNKESIYNLTQRVIEDYHQDMEALNCLQPSIEPKATDHIPQMINMIEKLLLNGNAYVSNSHVLFDVSSYKEYGNLSRRSQEEMIAGARIEIASYKKNPADFVLWKPAGMEQDKVSFNSPWGIGRPGWHIECSAMSTQYLGVHFDIHGGGADLMFPHHENEIAQSQCANKNAEYAKYWIHNGFLTVNGEKMSKSLGNYKTVRELLDQGVDGLATRYFYLTAHYRKPLDFNFKAINDAAMAVEKFRLAAAKCQDIAKNNNIENIITILSDDINTPAALSYLHIIAQEILHGSKDKGAEFLAACGLLGLDFKDNTDIAVDPSIDSKAAVLAEKRLIAKLNKNWKEADELRLAINALGYDILDTKLGYKLKKIITG